jgi:hypothetical protein
MQLACGVVSSLSNEVLYFTFESTPGSLTVLKLEPNLQEDTRKGSLSNLSLNLGKVHAEVLKFFLSALKDPIYNTMRCHLYHTVVFQGHSLAGAYATLAAAYFGHLRLTKVHCVTYGAPKVGDKVFCQRFEKVVDVSYRIVNDQDLIPKYPKDAKGHCYKHVFGKVKHKLNVPVRSPHKLENYVLNDMYDNRFLRYYQLQRSVRDLHKKSRDPTQGSPYKPSRGTPQDSPRPLKRSSVNPLYANEECAYEVAIVAPTSADTSARDLKVRSCIEPKPRKFNMGVRALKLKSR